MARIPVVSRTFKVYTYDVKLITENDEIIHEEISTIRPNTNSDKLRKQLELQYNHTHEEKADLVSCIFTSMKEIVYKLPELEFIKAAETYEKEYEGEE